MLALPTDEMFGDGTGEQTVAPEVEYVRQFADGKFREIVAAPDNLDGDVILGFNETEPRPTQSRFLKPVDRDSRVNIGYVGWDNHGFDVYVLCDVDLGDDGCSYCSHTDDW